MQVYDAAYTWRWMHKAEHYTKGQASFGDLLQVLNQYQQAPGLKAWFTSNHDENSWNGTEYEKYGAMALLLAVFSCTWPGVPLLYSGQELPNHKRLQFFEKDPIEWQQNNALHDFYRSLFGLKKNHPALASDASVHVISLDKEQKLLAFKRMAEKKEEEEVIVLLNFSGEQTSIPLNGMMKGSFSNPFSQEKVDLSKMDHIDLEPWGFSVFAT
jgi:glycosidase